MSLVDSSISANVTWNLTELVSLFAFKLIFQRYLKQLHERIHFERARS